MSTPTSKPTEASNIAYLLRAEVLSGRAEPGSKLKLVPLSEQYEVSRGPLREAAARLVAEGLLTAEDQRGFRVAPVSMEDLRDLTSTRKHIESRCLRDSIEAGELSWEGRVLAALHVVERATKNSPYLDEFAMHHRSFHETLVSACPSRYMLRFRAQLYDLTERYRNLAAAGYAKGQNRDIGAEHRAIAEAAVARDADLACELLEEHLAETTRLLIAAYPELFPDERA